MAELVLYVGNKTYSSWSLRPYLALKATGAPFREIVIPLRQSDTASAIRAHSPSGKVPALEHGEVRVWESLAICEYLAELFPGSGLWPRSAPARAVARSIASEMHAGFQALRQNLPMDLVRDRRAQSRADLVRPDIERIGAIWREMREGFGVLAANGPGPFLFGGFSIADAMYAPVATRFRTYGVELDEIGNAYMQAIFAWPAFREWEQAAKAEPWVIEYDLPPR